MRTHSPALFLWASRGAACMHARRPVSRSKIKTTTRRQWSSSHAATYVQHAIHLSASCQASRQSFTDLELEPLPFSFSRAEASSMRRQLAGHGTACCVTHTGRHQSQNLFITLALQKQLHEQGKGRRRTYVAPEVTNARTVREIADHSRE